MSRTEHARKPRAEKKLAEQVNETTKLRAELEAARAFIALALVRVVVDADETDYADSYYEIVDGLTEFDETMARKAGAS